MKTLAMFIFSFLSYLFFKKNKYHILQKIFFLNPRQQQYPRLLMERCMSHKVTGKGIVIFSQTQFLIFFDFTAERSRMSKLIFNEARRSTAVLRGFRQLESILFAMTPS